jgi:hypothetical protein
MDYPKGVLGDLEPKDSSDKADTAGGPVEYGDDDPEL